MNFEFFFVWWIVQIIAFHEIHTNYSRSCYPLLSYFLRIQTVNQFGPNLIRVRALELSLHGCLIPVEHQHSWYFQFNLSTTDYSTKTKYDCRIMYNMLDTVCRLDHRTAIDAIRSRSYAEKADTYLAPC